MAKKKQLNYWNYRVLAHQIKENEPYYELSIHEVYYTNDIPNGYDPKPYDFIHENIEDMKADFKLIKFAFKDPILHAGERFPEEFTEQNK